MKDDCSPKKSNKYKDTNNSRKAVATDIIQMMAYLRLLNKKIKK
jgi:hypothetical protein